MSYAERVKSECASILFSGVIAQMWPERIPQLAEGADAHITRLDALITHPLIWHSERRTNEVEGEASTRRQPGRPPAGLRPRVGRRVACLVRCLLSVGVVSTRTQMEADDGRAEHSDGH